MDGIEWSEVEVSDDDPASPLEALLDEPLEPFFISTRQVSSKDTWDWVCSLQNPPGACTGASVSFWQTEVPFPGAMSRHAGQTRSSRLHSGSMSQDGDLLC